MAKRYHDSGMMPSSETAFAKMHDQLVIKPYPTGSNWAIEEYDDTMGGVDRQISEDKAKRASFTKPRKA